MMCLLLISQQTLMSTLGEIYEELKSATFTASASLPATINVCAIYNTSSHGHWTVFWDNFVNYLDNCRRGWWELLQYGEFLSNKLVWEARSARFYMGALLPSMQWHSTFVLGCRIWIWIEHRLQVWLRNGRRLYNFDSGRLDNRYRYLI